MHGAHAPHLGPRCCGVVGRSASPASRLRPEYGTGKQDRLHRAAMTHLKIPSSKIDCTWSRTLKSKDGTCTRMEGCSYVVGMALHQSQALSTTS